MADFGDYVKDYDEETDLEVLVEPWQKYDILLILKVMGYPHSRATAEAQFMFNQVSLIEYFPNFLMTWLTSAIM
jgi:type III secretory pathway lipoprotein EscJ